VSRSPTLTVLRQPRSRLPAFPQWPAAQAMPQSEAMDARCRKFKSGRWRSSYFGQDGMKQVIDPRLFQVQIAHGSVQGDGEPFQLLGH
jgi:hypothetical protein